MCFDLCFRMITLAAVWISSLGAESNKEAVAIVQVKDPGLGIDL